MLADTSLPFGCIITPCTARLESEPLLRRRPATCDTCGGFINPHAELDFAACRWQCNLCSASNPLPDGLNTADAVPMFPELATDTVWFADPSLDASAPLTGELCLSHVLVIDTNLEPAEMRSLETALRQVVQSLPPECNLGLITLSNVVTVYEVIGSSECSAITVWHSLLATCSLFAAR